MAKISLNKLNLNKNTIINKVVIGGQEVEVLSYLPVSQKMDIIDLTIQESISGRKCSPILLDSMFHMYVVMSYSNITLSPTQKDALLETYDLMEKNGVISDIVSAIPSNEYADLVESLYAQVEKTEEELSSVTHLISDTIDRLSGTFESVQEAMNGVDFNSENIKDVLAIAKDNGVI